MKSQKSKVESQKLKLKSQARRASFIGGMILWKTHAPYANSSCVFLWKVRCESSNF